MRVRGSLLLGVLVVAACLFAASCSGAKDLKIGYKDWDENVAVANLTKILLEEDLGYDNVELKLVDLQGAFRETGSGQIDAFQDVWMPNHEKYLSGVRDDVVHLHPWFQGKTSYGIAVPDYMKTKSVADLDNSGTNMIVGLGSDAALNPVIYNKVIPAYDLHMKLVESSTPAMLDELNRAYKEKEPIVFLGWSPHWMNVDYKFRYLKDPKDAQGKYNNPSRLSSIVRKGLKDDDPVAYELLDSISLTEKQVNQMEGDINKAGDPATGVKAWLKDNRDVVKPWLQAAQKTQGS